MRLSVKKGALTNFVIAWNNVIAIAQLIIIVARRLGREQDLEIKSDFREIMMRKELEKDIQGTYGSNQ